MRRPTIRGPTLLILDEAWLFLDNSLFAARIKSWLKTLRKKNVSVLFATQSLADVEQSAIAATLIDSCPQKIFLPNERARESMMAAFYQRFGLNERQIDLLAMATPKSDYYMVCPRLTVIKEPPKNVVNTPPSETVPAESTQVRATTSARDPRAEEEEAALQSGLFPPGAPTSSAAAPRPASAVPRDRDNALAALDQLRQRLPTVNDLLPKGQGSAEDRRQSFLGAELDRSIYLKNGLQKPLSDYEIKARTVIPAALITGLNSDLPGEIIGQVTEHIYDTATGRHLLIPQGAKILGRYNADVGYGQDRLHIVWDRLIMPNGNSVQLEAMVGTDKAGYAGLADQVDYHLGHLIGAVILSSFISVGANLAADTGDNVIDALGDTAAQQAAQVGGQIVDRQLNIQPTITVRPGFKLNILVNTDMILEPYPAG